jgi:hypothetical protein
MRFVVARQQCARRRLPPAVVTDLPAAVAHSSFSMSSAMLSGAVAGA